jgi:hypothetical protein
MVSTRNLFSDEFEIRDISHGYNSTGLHANELIIDGGCAGFDVAYVYLYFRFLQGSGFVPEHSWLKFGAILVVGQVISPNRYCYSRTILRYPIWIDIPGARVSFLLAHLDTITCRFRTTRNDISFLFLVMLHAFLSERYQYIAQVDFIPVVNELYSSLHLQRSAFGILALLSFLLLYLLIELIGSTVLSCIMD